LAVFTQAKRKFNILTSSSQPMCQGTNVGCKLFQSVAQVFEWKDD